MSEAEINQANKMQGCGVSLLMRIFGMFFVNVIFRYSQIYFQENIF